MVELCPERSPLLEEGVEARAPTPAEAWALVRAGKANPFSVVYARCVLCTCCVGRVAGQGVGARQGGGQARCAHVPGAV